MAAPARLEAGVLFARLGGTDPERAWSDAPDELRAWARRAAEDLARLDARALLASDPAYPSGLRDLSDAPRVLFVRGALPERARAVAIVGSRAATPYGIACARRLGRDLAALGVCVVSGLARGIDAAAHEGALEAEGASVAVLPGGLDAVAPRHHRALAERLCERGGLATECPAGPPPAPGVFVRRNRLIAALTAVTVVVEAAERSGALSTAAAARRLARPLLAVPGDIDRPTARGANGLLRSGALVCESAADVLAALPLVESADSATPEMKLLAALDAGVRPAEALAAAAGLGLDETLASLLRLEWAGTVTARPGQRWARVRS